MKNLDGLKEQSSLVDSIYFFLIVYLNFELSLLCSPFRRETYGHFHMKCNYVYEEYYLVLDIVACFFGEML
jgi:hypothetical protein